MAAGTLALQAQRLIWRPQPSAASMYLLVVPVAHSRSDQRRQLRTDLPGRAACARCTMVRRWRPALPAGDLPRSCSALPPRLPPCRQQRDTGPARRAPWAMTRRTATAEPVDPGDLPAACQWLGRRCDSLCWSLAQRMSRLQCLISGTAPGDAACRVVVFATQAGLPRFKMARSGVFKLCRHSRTSVQHCSYLPSQPRMYRNFM